MGLNIGEYSRQTIYIYNKLAELSFEKGKPYNAFLITGIRAILTTLEYDAESVADIMTVIFQIRILLKRSRFFMTVHTDEQLLQEIQSSTRERDMRKCSSSLI